jgi:hypothetical protein
MIDELSHLIPSYPGDASQARCFNHVVALVAKSVVRQFDVPKGQAEEALDEAERELREMAEGIDIEDDKTQYEWEASEDDENGDGWIDEVAKLSIADREELEDSIRPVRLVLVKVSAFNPLV